MRSRFGTLLFVIGLVCMAALSAGAQQDEPTPAAQVSGGPTPSYVHPEILPSLDFLTQTAEDSGLTLGLQTGASYDSNGGAFSPGYGSVTRFFVMPVIGLRQIRPKLAWSFNYTGGLTAYPQGQQHNLFANLANADILYALAPHWQLHANDHFAYSSDPFASFYGAAGVPTLNDPNPTVYHPGTTWSSNFGLLDLTNQITAHDSITFSGTESFRRYSNAPNTLASNNFVQNLISYGGRANYQHAFSPRLSLGAGYNYTSLDFGHGKQRSGVQNIQATVDYQLTPNITLSGWVGPEYTTTKNIILLFGFFPITVHEAQWSPSGGVNFGWRGTKDSFRAGYSKQISDGGGIIGTTSLNYVTADYRRRLTARWDLDVGFLYGNNVSVSQKISPLKRRLNTTRASANLSWKYSPAINLNFNYANLYETQQNIYLYPTYEDNRVGFMLQYIWGHSLGR
jgi:hypothetical protein